MMFSYYGSKSKVIDYYPKPKFDRIIEPFCGSARYALKYFEKDVLLVDKYEKIILIWKYLQRCSKNDILKLPKLKLSDVIKRADFDCDEQFWLMGFIVQQGVNAPRLTVTKYAEDNIERQKQNIVDNLFKIKHWNFEVKDYTEIQNQKCTWFIDPPYQYGGEWYIHSNKKIDFNSLGNWCKSREGQIIVCENSKADWLPFKPMKSMQGSMYKTTESIYSNYPTNYDYEQLDIF